MAQTKQRLAPTLWACILTVFLCCNGCNSTQPDKYSPDPPLGREDAEFVRSQAEFYQHDSDRGLYWCDQAVRLNPEIPDVFFLRAQLLERQGFRDRAISDASEAIRLDPEYTDALQARASWYLDNLEYERAIADATKVIQASPDSIDALDTRSIAYTRKGDYDRAIADANESIRLSLPETSFAYYHRAFAYVEKGDFDQAIDDANIVDRDLGDLKWLPGALIRARAYLEKKDYDRAIADATVSIRLDMGLGLEKALSIRSRAYLENSDHDRAIADASEVIRLYEQAWGEWSKNFKTPPFYDTDLIEAYFSRARAHLETGQLDKAIADAAEAMRLENDSHSYQYRARAYFKIGKKTDAAEVFEKAQSIRRTLKQ